MSESSTADTSSTARRVGWVDDPLLRLFGTYGGPYKHVFAVAVLASLVRIAVDRAPTLVVAVALDAIFLNARPYTLPLVPQAWIPTGVRGQFVFTVVLLVGLYAAELAIRVVQSLASRWFGQRLLLDLRTDTYDAMQERSLSYFDEQETGQLVSILNNDVDNVDSFFGAVQQTLNLPLAVGVSFVYMAYVNWQLAATLLFAPAIIVALSLWYKRRIEPVYEEIRERIGDLNSRFENNISGIQTIKAYTAEQQEIERVEATADSRREVHIEQERLDSLINALLWVTKNVGIVVLFALGGYWILEGPPGVYSGTMTAGSLYLFYQYFQGFVVPLRGIQDILDSYENAKASAKRIDPLLSQRGEIQAADGTRTLTNVEGRVEYDGVRFAYEDRGSGETSDDTDDPAPEENAWGRKEGARTHETDAPDRETDAPPAKEESPAPDQDATARDAYALRDVSLTAEPGETIGIVGQTGAGKSTLMKLLFRFFDVAEGSITIDGVDLRDCKRRSLRSQLGYVEQEPFLFWGTVRENIAYATDNDSDAAVERAAKRAGAHEFITDLPDGYDTEVGERGVKLSGGQRQRIAIARALIRDPPVLVFDEATSHVDNETEAFIQDHLDDLTADRTTFVIAHRLSTVRDADRILVLDDGEIVERGTHEQLLDRDGIYANLWRVQIGEIDAVDDAFVEQTRDRLLEDSR